MCDKGASCLEFFPTIGASSWEDAVINDGVHCLSYAQVQVKKTYHEFPQLYERVGMFVCHHHLQINFEHLTSDLTETLALFCHNYFHASRMFNVLCQTLA